MYWVHFIQREFCDGPSICRVGVNGPMALLEVIYTCDTLLLEIKGEW